MRLKVPLAAAVAVVAVVVHSLLLVFLYRTLGGIMQRSHEAMFIADARSFAQFITVRLENVPPRDSPPIIAALLDSVIRDSNGVYAELEGAGIEARSALDLRGVQFPAQEDTAFGEHADNLFFFSVPVRYAGRKLQLRLGFDERPTNNTIEAVRHRMLVSLGLYLGVSALIAMMMGYMLTRPVRRLSAAAHDIAGGEVNRALTIRTPLRELGELGADLETMRAELVGAAKRLREQLEENIRLEGSRVQLERQLQHRERMATVGTLAGGIAHEVNNIVLPVLLLSELVLARPSLDGQTRQDVSTIQSAARRLRDLVRQILDFSREGGEVAMQSVRLADVVEEAIRLIRPLAAPDCRWVIDAMPGCPPVMADRGRTLQLVLNLCRNACQALEGKPGVVTVTVREARLVAQPEHDLVAGRYAELAVSDTGSGMDVATKARVFEPFFTRRGAGEGTGLGLSVAHGIAQGFGARILVESAPGEGSCFRVLFPLCEAS